jgi:uncharacterized protein
MVVIAAEPQTRYSRASIPKLLVLNTALMTAVDGHPFEQARADGRYWGRLVESAVGAHLHATYQERQDGLYYWRENNREVDFVLASSDLWAIEVKSGPARSMPSGIGAFSANHGPARKLLVGEGGIPIEEFLLGRLK